MKDQNKIVKYYETLYAEHGRAPRASDYGSPESQLIKFEVLGNVANYSGKSVLDVGCGFATFSGWLDKTFSEVDYYGVDITPSVAAEAAKSYPQHSIECRDVFSDTPGRMFDIVTANGIFYLVKDDPKEFMYSAIRKMFDLCVEAVAVNTLSKWADFLNDDEFYADPVETLEFCRSLTSRVTLRHDYMGHDFTLYLYK